MGRYQQALVALVALAIAGCAPVGPSEKSEKKSEQNQDARADKDENSGNNRPDPIAESDIEIASEGDQQITDSSSERTENVLPTIDPNVDGAPTPVLVIVGQGGTYLNQNIVVGGEGGQNDLLPSYGGLSWNTTGEELAVDQTFGIAFHPGSFMLTGMSGVTADTTQTGVDGTFFLYNAVHSSETNQYNPTFFFTATGLSGTTADVMAQKRGIVTREEDRYFFSRSTTPPVGREVTERLHYTEGPRFNTYMDDDTLSADEDFTGLFVSDADNEATRLAKATKMLLDGTVGVVNVAVETGPSGPTDFNTMRDYETKLGHYIGSALEAAARKNKPLVVVVLSDGGFWANVNNEDTDTRNQGGTQRYVQNPASSNSGALMMVYSPAGRPGLVGDNDRQVGHYTALTDDELNPQNGRDRVVSPLSPRLQGINPLEFAKHCRNVAEAIAANYYALHGYDQMLDWLKGHSARFAVFGNEMVKFSPSL